MEDIVATVAEAVPSAQEEFDDCLTLLKEETDAINELVQIKTFPKGTLLIQEGETSKNCYHILKGCVRQYYLRDGEEKTTFFYTEGHSILSLRAEVGPVKHFLECVEETTTTVLSRDKEQEMYARHPRLETLCRISLQQELADYQEMLATYITTTPEERYSHLLEERPELLNRVPQYQLASYLGVKPESLSRIRKRIAQKALA